MRPIRSSARSAPEREPSSERPSTETILGVRFLNAPLGTVLEAVAAGGLVVAPSAPGLVLGTRDRHYHDAISRSDVALTDSGLMVLCWTLLTRRRLRRWSGPRILKHLLEAPEFRHCGGLFLVNPSADEGELNARYLRSRDIHVDPTATYAAPRYGQGPIVDEALAERIETARPRFVLINIGGGVQERLGLYLRDALTYRPAILCFGAAIAFFTGAQVRLPWWVDKLYLGWLARSLKSPSRFLPRYLDATALPYLLWKFRDRSPWASSAGPGR